MTQLIEERVTKLTAESLPTPFKVFGLQRSGTNLMVALMSQNFHVHSLEIGAEWKHGPLKARDRNWNGQVAKFVFCVRNPYAWLHSCYRYFRRANGADPTVPRQFRQDPSVSFEEFVLTPTYGFATPIHRWNEMVRHWLKELPADRTVMVRQEDQMVDQLSVLSRLEEHLQLRRRLEELSPIEHRVDVNARLNGSYEADREYYLDRQYMAAYSPTLLEKVNAVVDRQAMQQLNYETESHVIAEREVRGITLHVRPLTSDAADARDCTFDRYGFESLKKSGISVKTYVDIGAHIGSTLSLAKRYWPECRTLCYEPIQENARLLRINARRFSGVTVVSLAVGDGKSPTIALSQDRQEPSSPLKTSTAHIDHKGSQHLAAVGLNDVIERIGAIDLLKIGCPHASKMILQQLKEVPAGMVRIVCGRALPKDRFARWVTAELGDRYELQMLGKRQRLSFRLTLRAN